MILKSETYKKGIIYSSLFNVGGKSVAFIQQWLIGYYFGTHSDTDVFFFTYNIILFISYFFLNFTTSVLIPEGMKIRNQESDEKSKLFLNSYIQTYGLIGILLAIISLLDPISIFSIISSFPDNVITDNLTLITWCLPLIFLNITVSIMTEILASYKYFTAPNLVTFINYTFGILFIVFFHDSLGINVIAIGLIAGYLLNFFIILHFMHKVLHWKFIQRPHFRIKQVFGSGIYSQAGYIVYLVALYVPQYIFSQLPAGSLTAINFADKLLPIRRLAVAQVGSSFIFISAFIQYQQLFLTYVVSQSSSLKEWIKTIIRDPIKRNSHRPSQLRTAQIHLIGACRSLLPQCAPRRHTAAYKGKQLFCQIFPCSIPGRHGHDHGADLLLR